MDDISDKDTGMGAQPEPLTREEIKQPEQDPLESEIAKEFERQIREHGEIKQYGLPWWIRPEFEPDDQEPEG